VSTIGFQYPGVGTVCPGSVAEKAGIVVGDIILAVNGIDYMDPLARAAIKAAHGDAGGTVVLRTRRGSVERDVSLTVRPQ
jgi:S1-C subfamily serine protease